ncbi:hypothetical protein PV11_06449 [Exophiala sideris]|uniref:Peroxidase n=1 Tax=Exophiala sideris TaxID=1016849 RepID=A0A0D1VRX0_9EURO|nr:hypothetical protein PV11_06449 [Exophiala sideris]
MSISPQPKSSSSDHPSAPSASQLSQVAAAIKSLLRQPDYDDGSAGPVLVRLAWHSAGTYCKDTNTGGSNGAGMRYEAEGGDPANAGLQHARAFLEPIKAQFPFITYADLWTLAAVVAIREMDGPQISWKPGRTDFTDDSRIPPRGRLPDGAKGADHLRWIFYRMGFNDQEIVALSGASIWAGATVTARGSKANGLLKMHDWKKKKLANGMEQFVYVDEDLEPEEQEEETLMMLPTDIALLEDPSFRVWVDRYAEDKNLFFRDFAAVFAKLLELGIRRDKDGTVVNEENLVNGYRSAPKKSDVATVPKDQNAGQVGHEARRLMEENAKHGKVAIKSKL